MATRQELADRANKANWEILGVERPTIDGLHTAGALALSVVPEKFKTTVKAVYQVSNVMYEKVVTDALVFSAAHTVTASKFGVILVQINAAGTISTKVPGATQAYDTIQLARADLPAPDAGNVALGSIEISSDAGDWVANTDDMTNGSDLTTAAFVNATLAAVQDEKVRAYNRITRESFFDTPDVFNAVFSATVPADDGLRVHYNADGTPATVKDAAGNVVFTYT